MASRRFRLHLLSLAIATALVAEFGRDDTGAEE